MRAGENETKTEEAKEARKVHQRHRQTKEIPAKHNRTKRPSGNQTGGGAGQAEEDRGGEGCTNLGLLLAPDLVPLPTIDELRAQLHRDLKIQQVEAICPDTIKQLPLRIIFFSSGLAVRTRHGPYNWVSGEKHSEKGHVWSQNAGKSSHQHKPNNKKKNATKNDPQIPQPDLRFAKKQNSEATKNGAGPKQKPNQTFSDLPRIQWRKSLYHHQKHAN